MWASTTLLNAFVGHSTSLSAHISSLMRFLTPMLKCRISPFVIPGMVERCTASSTSLRVIKCDNTEGNEGCVVIGVEVEWARRLWQIWASVLVALCSTILCVPSSEVEEAKCLLSRSILEQVIFIVEYHCSSRQHTILTCCYAESGEIFSLFQNGRFMAFSILTAILEKANLVTKSDNVIICL